MSVLSPFTKVAGKRMFAHENSWHSQSVRRIIRHHSTLPEQFSVCTGKQGSFHPYSSLFTPICFDSSPNKIPKDQCNFYTLAPQSNEQQQKLFASIPAGIRVLKTTWCYISIWGFLKAPKLVVSHSFPSNLTKISWIWV